MDLSTALQNIKKIRSKLAKEEILCIRENKEEAIPVLLNYVQHSLDNLDDLTLPFEDYENSEDTIDPMYAMFLLAEFKVHDAFKPFTDILKLEYDQVDYLLSDTLTGDYAAMIASVSTENDISYIKSIIEDKSLNEFQSIAALNVLITLYVEGVYKKKDLIEYLGFLLDYFVDDCLQLSNVVYSCYRILAKEHYDKIFEYYEKELIDESYIDRDSFKISLIKNNEEKLLEILKSDPYVRFIEDTIKSMKYWACFRKEKTNDFIPSVVLRPMDDFKYSSKFDLSQSSTEVFTLNQPKPKKKRKIKNKPKKTKSWKK